MFRSGGLWGRWFSLVLAGSLLSPMGCGDDASLTCGPGTQKEGSQCVAVAIDAGAAEDAAPVEDIAPVEDATPVEDIAPVEDATPVEDIAPVEDAAPVEVVAGMDCHPEGTWSLDISSAALPGEGCGADGSQGQGDNTKVYTVTVGDDGALVGTLPEMTEPVPVVTVEQVPSDVGCAVVITMTAVVVFPPEPDGTVDTITAAYTYNVTAIQGVISGEGELHMTTINSTGFVKVDCTEPISLGGLFTPEGG